MPTQREIIAARLAYADEIIAGAKRAGVPLYAAAALADMESEGENIYGGDGLGTSNPGKFAAKPRIKVTEENFKEFYEAVVVRGHKSNGVGPLQITYNGRIENGKRIGSFFMDAKAKGLELWKVEDNFTYGFGLLADYIKQFKSDWFAVGKRYNGKESYGTTFKRVVSEWKERLEGATDDEETNVPALWYPGATKREIKPGSNDPAIKPIGVILHVDAGNTRDLYNYFNGPSGGIESHFQIAKDGTVFQYRDLGHEADANYKGNSFTVNGVRRGYVSVETQGLEKGEWTDAQITAIKALLFWLHEEYDIPLRKAPSPTSAGIGYHTMFGAPGAWTPVAKSCPGPDRIRQFNNVLLPWMAQVNGSQPPVPPVVITPKPTIVKLSSGVKPNARHAQVILLKQLLMEGGYAKKGSLALDSLYGSGTRKAVAAFYKANKSLSTSSYDTAIGPKGFEELQREVYAKR